MPTRDPHTPGYVTATELPDGAVPDPSQNGNFIIGPTHSPAPELADPDRALDGTVVEFTMSSEDSKYFPGIARKRRLAPDARPGESSAGSRCKDSSGALCSQGCRLRAERLRPRKRSALHRGRRRAGSRLFAALDELIAEHKLPPIVAVSIGNGGGDAQGSERGLEYDTMSDRYAEFVEHEVLPAVESHAHVQLTHDPDGRATMGASSGGSCALIMAWFHPEWYHRVLVYSGTYVNQQWPWNPRSPHGAWGFHERLIPHSRRKPLRMWLEVGDRDLFNPNTMRDNMHDWVLANERMAEVLDAKHYPYQFVFARNAGHVDRGVQQQTLPEALEYIWQGYGPR